MLKISNARTGPWRGYTLVELMIVMGIIGILASVAITSLPRMKLDQRIARSARVFGALVREARGRSISNRVYTRIEAVTNLSGGTITISQRRCMWGEIDPIGGNCAPCPPFPPLPASCSADDWEILRTIQMGSGDFSRVMLASRPNTGTIVWTPRGLPDTANTDGVGVYLFRELGDAAGARAQTWGCRVTASGQVEVR